MSKWCNIYFTKDGNIYRGFNKYYLGKGRAKRASITPNTDSTNACKFRSLDFSGGIIRVRKCDIVACIQVPLDDENQPEFNR